MKKRKRSAVIQDIQCLLDERQELLGSVDRATLTRYLLDEKAVMRVEVVIKKDFVLVFATSKEPVTDQLVRELRQRIDIENSSGFNPAKWYIAIEHIDLLYEEQKTPKWFYYEFNGETVETEKPKVHKIGQSEVFQYMRKFQDLCKTPVTFKTFSFHMKPGKQSI